MAQPTKDTIYCPRMQLWRPKGITVKGICPKCSYIGCVHNLSHIIEIPEPPKRVKSLWPKIE